MIPGRITIEQAYEDDPPGGECFALYASRDGLRNIALGRCCNEWSEGGPLVPFPNDKAANAAIHCIPIPEGLR